MSPVVFRLRSSIVPAVLVVAGLLFAGCLDDLPVNSLKCTTSDHCPSGYVCAVPPGICQRTTDGSLADVIPPVGDASGIDGPRATGGVEAGGEGPGVDAGADAPTDAPAAGLDGSIDSSAGGNLGTGGTGGRGGTSGTGPSGGSGGSAVVDAPIATGEVGGVVTGGISGTGGAIGTGGILGTGGAGTGGTTVVCQGSATQCSANGVQTCTNGQWGAAIVCGPHQTCGGAVGTVKCTCNIDSVCGSVGAICAGTSTLVNCAQDAQACFYKSSSMPCSNGLCSGVAGAASCCTNACTSGLSCLSSTSLQTCAVGANGCTAATSTTCASGLVCERYATPACVDPNWAEWPMPNGSADVSSGAPTPESYTDNGNGTVTDNVTGLMWQQAAPTTTYTLAGAIAYCSTTLSLAGHTDWRLPSFIELISIVDFGLASPSLNAVYFPGTPSAVFWSSTNSTTTAWDVSFVDGSPNEHSGSTLENVRCVR